MSFLSRLVWGLSVLMATFTVVGGVYLLVTEATWEDVKWWIGLGALFANLTSLALAMCLSWLAPTLVIVVATMLATLWCANIRPKVCASILLVGAVGYFSDILLLEHQDRHVVVSNGKVARRVEIFGLRDPFSEEVIRMEFRKTFSLDMGYANYMVETMVVDPLELAKWEIETKKNSPYKAKPRFVDSWANTQGHATKWVYAATTSGKDPDSHGLSIHLYRERGQMR